MPRLLQVSCRLHMVLSECPFQSALLTASMVFPLSCFLEHLKKQHVEYGNSLFFIKSTGADIENAFNILAMAGGHRWLWHASLLSRRLGLGLLKDSSIFPRGWALFISQVFPKSPAFAHTAHVSAYANKWWMASSIRYVLKACFPATPIIKPQRSRADQSQGIYSAGSIKRGEVLSLRSLWHSPPDCLLFQPIIWAEYSLSVQTTLTAGRFFPDALLRCSFTCDKTVEVVTSEIYVFKHLFLLCMAGKTLKIVYIILYYNVNALAVASQRKFQGNNQSLNRLNLLRQ